MSSRTESLFYFSTMVSTLMLLFGSNLFRRCAGSERKCYIVDNQSSGTVNVCYFAPRTSSGATWEEATKTCTTYGASLATIPTKVIQGVLENYLDTQHITYSFWTAARKVQSSEWKWINGKPYAGKSIKKQYESNIYAALNRNLTYVEQAPSNLNHFVCQIQDERCSQSVTDKLNDSCIVKISNIALNVFHARNECIDEGGDLPIIESEEELIRVAGILLHLSPSGRVWMGLRKLWWEWSKREELRYSNWAFSEGGNLAEECMVVEHGTFKWKQQYCSENERILCQIVSKNYETAKGNKTTIKSTTTKSTTTETIAVLVAGLVLGIGVIVPLLIIIVILIAIIANLRKKQRKVSVNRTSGTADAQYEGLQNLQVYTNDSNDYAMLTLQS